MKRILELVFLSLCCGLPVYAQNNQQANAENDTENNAENNAENQAENNSEGENQANVEDGALDNSNDSGEDINNAPENENLALNNGGGQANAFSNSNSQVGFEGGGEQAAAFTPSEALNSAPTESFIPGNNLKNNAAANGAVPVVDPGLDQPVNPAMLEPIPAGTDPSVPVVDLSTSGGAVTVAPVVSMGVVRYVRSDGLQIRREPLDSAPSSGTLEQGDHPLVVEQGTWAKINEGQYVPLNELSLEGIGRPRRPSSWR